MLDSTIHGDGGSEGIQNLPPDTLRSVPAKKPHVGGVEARTSNGALGSLGNLGETFKSQPQVCVSNAPPPPPPPLGSAKPAQHTTNVKPLNESGVNQSVKGVTVQRSNVAGLTFQLKRLQNELESIKDSEQPGNLGQLMSQVTALAEKLVEAKASAVAKAMEEISQAESERKGIIDEMKNPYLLPREKLEMQKLLHGLENNLHTLGQTVIVNDAKADIEQRIGANKAFHDNFDGRGDVSVLDLAAQALKDPSGISKLIEDKKKSSEKPEQAGQTSGLSTGQAKGPDEKNRTSSKTAESARQERSAKSQEKTLEDLERTAQENADLKRLREKELTEAKDAKFDQIQSDELKRDELKGQIKNG